MKTIIRAGGGTDNIDRKYSENVKGVQVLNTPGANKDAVAELTLGLAIGIDRKIPDNVKDL